MAPLIRLRWTAFLVVCLLGSSTLTARPDDPAERLRQARDDLAHDRYNQAVAIYEEVCPRVRNADCWNELGVTRMSMGGYTRALESFERAHKLRPGSGEILSHMAMAAFAARRHDVAGDYHRRALQAAPAAANVRVNYGIYLLRSRRYDAALREFNTVVRAHPRDFFARLGRGRALYHLGRKDEALRELDQGIAINPRFFDLYYARAVVKFKTGDFGGALADLRRAEKINPINGRTGPLRTQIRRKMNQR